MRWDYPPLDINPVFPGLGEIIISIIIIIIIIVVIIIFLNKVKAKGATIRKYSEINHLCTGEHCPWYRNVYIINNYKSTSTFILHL